MSGAVNAGLGYRGFQEPETAASQFNALEFHIRSVLARLATATLVRVVGVTNAGGIAPAGFVDIQPLVAMTDGAGNTVPHGVIHACPYARLQGGANAVILDPQPGDIGIAVFASRDISAATATRAPAPPGSWRQYDWADGLYVGGCLNGTPSQFVAFSAGGIAITSPVQVTITAPLLQINGELVCTGEGTFAGGHTVSQHTHTQPADGHGDSEATTDTPQG